MQYTNNLKAIRTQSGLTLRQVATQMNMQCESRLSEWERGASIPSLFNLLKLCEIYQIDPRDAFASLPMQPEEPSLL
jgi:transcriptional regulator with XRE-family HTH domain